MTPDGRYFVVRGRLWRMANPALPEDRREVLVHELEVLVHELMTARRAVATARKAKDRKAEADAHAAVDRAKIALGERGTVWWDDGAPDLNRHLARTGPYAAWYAALPPGLLPADRGGVPAKSAAPTISAPRRDVRD